jgi:hypothetical protein
MTLELAPVDVEVRTEAEHAWYHALLSDRDPPTIEELNGSEHRHRRERRTRAFWQ